MTTPYSLSVSKSFIGYKNYKHYNNKMPRFVTTTQPQGHYYSSQESPYSNMNTNIRQMSVRTSPSEKSNTKYYSPMSSSLRLNEKKSYVIGKSSMNHSTYNSMNVSNNTVRTSLRRVRASGCTAPRKKGALKYY